MPIIPRIKAYQWPCEPTEISTSQPPPSFHHYLSSNRESLFFSFLFSLHISLVSAVFDSVEGSGFNRGCWKQTNTFKLSCAHPYASWPNSPHPLEAVEIFTVTEYSHTPGFLCACAKSLAISSNEQQGQIYLPFHLNRSTRYNSSGRQQSNTITHKSYRILLPVLTDLSSLPFIPFVASGALWATWSPQTIVTCANWSKL